MNVSLRALALASVTTAALVVAASAAAHAHVSPPVALSKSGQVFTLAVPTEKEGKTTTKIVLTVPTGSLSRGTHRLTLLVSDYEEAKNMENVGPILPNTRALSAIVTVR